MFHQPLALWVYLRWAWASGRRQGLILFLKEIIVSEIFTAEKAYEAARQATLNKTLANMGDTLTRIKAAAAGGTMSCEIAHRLSDNEKDTLRALGFSLTSSSEASKHLVSWCAPGPVSRRFAGD